MSKLYVYGTLRKEGRWHPSYLKNSKFIGYVKLKKYKMSVFKKIPYAFFTGDDNDYMIVEEYEVSREDMRRIDDLEYSYDKKLLSNDRIIYLMPEELLKNNDEKVDLTLPKFIYKDYIKDILNIDVKYDNLKEENPIVVKEARWFV